jgi:hypothetical protein
LSKLRGRHIAGTIAALALVLGLWALLHQETPPPMPSDAPTPAIPSPPAGGPGQPRAAGPVPAGGGTMPLAPVPVASRDVTPEPDRSFQLIVRVWNRDGRPVEGAEVSFRWSRFGPREPEEEQEPCPPLLTGPSGEAFQEMPGPGPFLAIGRWNDQAILERFGFGQQSVLLLDLVLESALVVHGKTVSGNGLPVADATIRALWDGRSVAAVASGPSGSFQFESTLPAGVILRAEALGFAPAVSAPVETSEPVTLVLTSGGQIVASVLDRERQSPVAGFTLRLDAARGSGLLSRTSVSAADGTVIFKALAPGSYSLRSGDRRSILDPAESKVEIRAGDDQRLKLAVVNAAELRGHVLDGASGAGIPGVVVDARFADTPLYPLDRVTTDSTGSFHFDGLPAGNFDIGLMDRPPLYGRAVEHGVTDLQRISLSPGESRDGITFTLEAGAMLRGVVRHQDGSPAPGANVSATAPDPDSPGVVIWSQDTTTDRNGRFVVAHAPGEVDLFVQARWRGRASDTAGPVRMDVAPPSEIVLTLAPAEVGILAGQVIDTTGRPLIADLRGIPAEGNAGLAILPLQTTASDGHFIYTDVPAGTYMFELGRHTTGLVNMSGQDGPVTLEPGQVLSGLQLVLPDGGLSIGGTVRNPDGSPVTHCFIEVEFFGAEGMELYTEIMTDDGGAFLVENVEEGAYRLRPRDEHLAGEWEAIVNAGETVEIVVPEIGAPPADTPEAEP